MTTETFPTTYTVPNYQTQLDSFLALPPEVQQAIKSYSVAENAMSRDESNTVGIAPQKKALATRRFNQARKLCEAQGIDANKAYMWLVTIEGYLPHDQI